MSQANIAYDQRLTLRFDANSRRRHIANREMIIHCHHYNTRLQETIEGSSAIDGKYIFVSSAEAVFRRQLLECFSAAESDTDKWRFASQLYSHLGYGKLDLSRLDDGFVLSPSSHIVEGWLSGFPTRREPVCSLTQGFLQGAHAAILGKRVKFTEVECQVDGAAACKFELGTTTEDAFDYEPANCPSLPSAELKPPVASPTVDEEKIVQALVDSPLYGDQNGLIPAFNVYLASTPADFYNLIAIRYVESMMEQDLDDVARLQLTLCAEHCGLNTFRGIRDSAEWESLIAPMVHSKEDELLAMIAVSNGLGWGNWQVSELKPAHSMALQTCNGYESLGYRHLRGASELPTCVMLAGVSVGIFELVYGFGSPSERFGQSASEETHCACIGNPFCEFRVQTL